MSEESSHPPRQVKTPPAVDAAELAKEIEHLLNIHSDKRLGDYIADVLRDRVPDPVSLAAFRSPELAERSLLVLSAMIRQVNEDIASARRRGSPDLEWERAAGRMRTKFGLERARIDAIMRGRAAEAGLVNVAEPNPRKRAKDRLWEMVLRGEPVDQSTPRTLLNEELEITAAKKREQEAEREARRQARKQARREQSRDR